MRMRKMDANGDFVFGHSGLDYLVNTPECVAQAIGTRLRLWEGEWFADITDGMPWLRSVLGKYTSRIRDMAIRRRVLGTPGVLQILSYVSNLNEETRVYDVRMTVETAYGVIRLTSQTILAVDYDRLDVDFILDRSYIL